MTTALASLTTHPANLNKLQTVVRETTVSAFLDDVPGQSQSDTTASETKHDENDGSFGFFTEPKPAQPIKDEDAYGFFDQEKSSATTPANKPPARAAKPPAKKPAKTATKNDASSIRVETTKI